MSFIEIEALSEAQVSLLLELYKEAWWTKTRTLQQARRVVENSDLVFGLVEPSSERLVAFSRVLTDFTFKAFIYDVIVEQSLRGTGLGMKIMSQLLAHPKLAEVPHIELYCQPEMFAFYQKLGFTTNTENNQLMRLQR